METWTVSDQAKALAIAVLVAILAIVAALAFSTAAVWTLRAAVLA